MTTTQNDTAPTPDAPNGVDPVTGAVIYTHPAPHVPATHWVYTDGAWLALVGTDDGFARMVSEDGGDGPAVRVLPIADRPSSGTLRYADADGSAHAEGETAPTVEGLVEAREGGTASGEVSQVEVRFADGSSARWAAIPAEVADLIERTYGAPDTVGP